jgi:hypothetical protein
MRHGEEPEALPAIPPIPWRETVGLFSPSSGTEVVHDSPEEYEVEEPRAQSLSPASMKRYQGELEKDIKEMSSCSEEYDPTGKTPEELDVMIARYHRDLSLAGLKRISAVRWKVCNICIVFKKVM